MEDVVLNPTSTERVTDEDLLADIELLSETELAKVGGGQGIVVF
jgi:hypothetical protein